MNEKGIQAFAEEVKDRILDYLPDNYRNSEIKLSSTRKVNRDVTNITVVPDWAEEGVVPTLHLEAMYEAYRHGKAMEDILQSLSETIVNAYNSLEKKPLDYEHTIREIPEDKIYFQLINTESNREYLETIPHRNLHDMSVIYRALISKEDDGVQSIVVTKDLQDNWGVSEDTLFELASENTKELFPPKIQSMAEVMMQFFGEDMAMSDEELSEVMGDSGLWLISNDLGVNGASNLIYGDLLEEVTEKLEDDVYIIPSSLHEILAVPASMVDPNEIGQMVRDINQSTVREEDRLSNQVFFYGRNSKQLVVACESPIKGIKDQSYQMSEPARDHDHEAPNHPTPTQRPAFAR